MRSSLRCLFQVLLGSLFLAFKIWSSAPTCSIFLKQTCRFSCLYVRTICCQFCHVCYWNLLFSPNEASDFVGASGFASDKWHTLEASIAGILPPGWFLWSTSDIPRDAHKETSALLLSPRDIWRTESKKKRKISMAEQRESHLRPNEEMSSRTITYVCMENVYVCLFCLTFKKDISVLLEMSSLAR